MYTLVITIVSVITVVILIIVSDHISKTKLSSFKKELDLENYNLSILLDKLASFKEDYPDREDDNLNMEIACKNEDIAFLEAKVRRYSKTFSDAFNEMCFGFSKC